MVLFHHAEVCEYAAISIGMTAESVTAAAAVATLVVVGASAIAALVQLRHMRNSNQIAVFNEIRHRLESAQFRDALQFIRYELPAKLNDAEFRSRLLNTETSEAKLIIEIGNFFDFAVAPLVKHRFVDRDLACDLLYFPSVLCWDSLAPFISSRRAMVGYRMWEDFEYLALLCKQFRKRHPLGTYPNWAPPLPLPEPWPEAVRRDKTQADLGEPHAD